MINPSRLTRGDKPLTPEQAANAKRYADYIARRQGVAAPTLKIWRMK